MLRILRYLIPVLLVILLFSCRQKGAEIPINDFFKTPEKSAFRISPDGKYVTYIKPDKQKQNLYVIPANDVMNGIESGKLAADLGGFAGRGYQWTYDNQIVFTQRNPLTSVNKICVLDMNSFKIRDLLAEENVTLRIANVTRQTPDQITIEMNKRDSAYFDVFHLNIKTGELKSYYVNTNKVTDWYPDEEGKILLAKVSDGVDETILYRPNESAPFRAIIKNNFTESVTPIAFTVARDAFYAFSNINRDKTAIVTINPLTGKEQQVVFASDKADVGGRYSWNKHRLDFASWQEEKPKKHFLNGDAERIYRNLLKHSELSGNEVNIMSSDTAEDKFIVSSYTDRDPGAVYLYQSTDDKLRLLVKNGNFQPDQLCAMRPIRYKASDGTVINGYLTLPQGDSTNLPLVVMPHDGLVVPFNRDLWGYNVDVQFLANRGYAVFQPNYRGTIGYGKAFYKAGFKQAGGLVQNDITDGVNWLIANKIANPKKIAIYGRGFGGFSALYGLAFHQNLYSCAIVRDPLINFFSYISNVPPFVKPSIQMVYERVGDPVKDADELSSISPAFFPNRIKSPLLIFPATAYETRPNASQNELNQFVRDVKRHGVTVVYTKPPDRNTMRGGPNRTNRDRIVMYSEIEKFLDTQMHVKH